MPIGLKSQVVSRARPQRTTVAILIDYMDLALDGFEQELRTAFKRTGRELELDVIIVYGRAFDAPDGRHWAHNSAYRALQGSRVEGMITLSASLGAMIGLASVSEFLKRHDTMARCSCGAQIPGIPSVVIDNRVGMEAAVEHLVRDHHRRRVAFLSGPEENVEARVRQQCYSNVLARYGIDADPSLVEAGDFVRRTGHLAMQRILDRNSDVDAVVAANDSMALGAVTALQARRLRVPRDVAVTGFDDLAVARLGNPPLTSVSQPLDLLASTALHLVAEQLAGRAVPELTHLPARLVIRQSCGCNSRTPLNRTFSLPSGGGSNSACLNATIRSLRASLPSRELTAELEVDAGQLLEALQAVVEGSTDAFAGKVESMLELASHQNERYQQLQLAITFIREQLRELATPDLEDLLDDARTQIALTNTRAQTQQRYELDEIYHRLLENREKIGAVFDWVSLTAALERELPTLGLTSVHISRFPDSEPSRALSLLCIPHGDYDPKGVGALDLAPSADCRSRLTLLFPLVHENYSFGVIAFEERSGLSGFQIVSEQVGAAMGAVTLHEKILEKKALHAQQAQERERLATRKRIESLSVLAGGVAHDLNNALGPLVALPQVILRELEQLDQSVALHLVDAKTDLATIQAAALRASYTIKDLLTLGRQGRTAKEPLDLNRVVSDCLVVNQPVGSERTRYERSLVVELNDEPLPILGSEAHLGRATMNLVHNAMEATVQGGHVTVKTNWVHVDKQLAGFETIEPGDYAAITVADTGSGIPTADLGRIFEPFFSSKKVSERSGSGLGLAIVFGVVKEHDGFVNVESVVGCGTQFTLYFPLHSVPAPIDKHQAAAQVGQAKILVVDDDPVQLRTARRVLTHLGYDVDTFGSGRLALEHLAKLGDGHSGVVSSKRAYDLVIVDMLLNEADDGLVIIERIERIFPGQRAIVASGHASPERLEAVGQRDVIWVTKPYTVDSLGRAVQLGLKRASMRPKSLPP
jgi:phosphoserine phosphatase RsbU/P